MKLTNHASLEFMDLSDDGNFDSPFVTLILKGTYDIKPNGVCTLAKKQRAIIGDRRNMDDIGRSLAWASDMAPFKPHSDFCIHGTFYQLGGVEAPEGRASFEFGPLRKTLALFGPRTVAQLKGGRPVVTPPAPFMKLPLRWEYSAGGLRDRRNPMGMGTDSRTLDDGTRIWSLPLIENAERMIRTLADRPPPANFVPVPPFFQERRRKLGTRDQRWSLFRAPFPPNDFDPSYYNAAPGDQQAGNYPRGDETIVLRNMHPKHPHLTFKLPAVAANAAVLRDWEGQVTVEAVAMNLDTVVALPDEDQIVLVWRGRCPLHVRGYVDELIWAAVETVPVNGPAPDPPLPERLLALYQGELDAAAAAAAAAEAEAANKATAEADALAKAAADAMAEIRSIASKAKLPPELMKLIESTSNPEELLGPIEQVMDQMFADLEKHFPGITTPPAG